MHLQEKTLCYLWPWPWVQDHMKCCPVPSKPCDLYTCKIWRCSVEGLRRICIYSKYIIWPCQGHRKCCQVPATLCDLCTCKVWSNYIKWLRRRCIYKKIHYLTFDPNPDPKVKVKQNVAQFSLHHVLYVPAKSAVAMYNDLTGDEFTRNVTEGRKNWKLSTS